MSVYVNNRISVVVPTYCEASNLVPLTGGIVECFKKNGIDDYEIIVVDDDSPDNTKEVCRLLKSRYPSFRLISRAGERGLATAVRRGIEEAAGNIIVTMDADLSHDPEVIPRLVYKLITCKCDIVVASRYIDANSGSYSSLQRVWGSRLLNLFVRNLLRIPVKDVTGGFHAMRKDLFNKHSMNYIFNGYGDYSIVLLYEAARQGLRIIETGFVYRFRRNGSSKTAVLKTGISYGIRAVKLRLGLDGLDYYARNYCADAGNPVCERGKQMSSEYMQ
jgi:dolichol-phosphate mannosyltransferase